MIRDLLTDTRHGTEYAGHAGYPGADYHNDQVHVHIRSEKEQNVLWMISMIHAASGFASSLEFQGEQLNRVEANLDTINNEVGMW